MPAGGHLHVGDRYAARISRTARLPALLRSDRHRACDRLRPWPGQQSHDLVAAGRAFRHALFVHRVFPSRVSARKRDRGRPGPAGIRGRSRRTDRCVAVARCAPGCAIHGRGERLGVHALVRASRACARAHFDLRNDPQICGSLARSAAPGRLASRCSPRAGGHATPRDRPAGRRADGTGAARAAFSLQGNRQRERGVRPRGAARAQCGDLDAFAAGLARHRDADPVHHRRRRYDLSAVSLGCARAADGERARRAGRRRRALREPFSVSSHT